MATERSTTQLAAPSHEDFKRARDLLRERADALILDLGNRYLASKAAELTTVLDAMDQRYRGRPMTLANMRENGVRSLSVACELCHHEPVLNVDAFGNAIPIPAFGPRMVCTSAASSAHSPGQTGWTAAGERV